jgi:phospholipid-binding lipoprotein MlaA
MLSKGHGPGLRLCSCILLLALMSGCATGPNPRDPYEALNRKIYQFNEGVDKAVLKPAAQVYRTVVPDFLRLGISNFFSNIDDIFIALNNVLQGKFAIAYSDLGRIAINSTLGLGGLFDIASDAGIDKHEEDFGQTLGVWGVRDGPYIMLPFLGPSSGRDTVGRGVDFFLDPIALVNPASTRYLLWSTRIVSDRAEGLEAGNILQRAALDKYEFLREAYLQRRRSLIFDGTPPLDPDFRSPPDATKPNEELAPNRTPHPGNARILGTPKLRGRFD